MSARQQPEATAPLSGIRVLDLTSAVAGPFGTLQLAELGADVVKVEPLAGDSMRGVAGARAGGGAGFHHVNRHKRSIAIDLKDPAGRAIVFRLLEGADAFVASMRLDALARLGLDYDAVVAAAPSIVYAVVTGYGTRGPYAGRPAVDDLIQAAAAIPAAQGLASGDEGPRYAAITVASRSTGLALANAVLAGLLSRARTGRGHYVEVPMFETVARLVLGDHLGDATFDPDAATGNRRLLDPYRRPYPTADGFISVVVRSDADWHAFAGALGEAELFSSDARFTDAASRARNIADLYDVVGERLRARRTVEWMDLFDAIDLTAAAAPSLEGLLLDAHLVDVGMIETVSTPGGDVVRHLRRPSEWEHVAAASTRRAPLLGEHTVGVLNDAGYEAEEISMLLASGVVATNPDPDDASGRT